MSEPQDRPPGRPLPPARPARPVPGQSPSRPGAVPPRPGDHRLPPHLDPRAPRRPHGSRRTTAGPPGAPVPSRPAGARASRILSLLAVVTSFAVLAVAVGGYLLVNKYDRQIDRIPGVFAALDDRPQETPRDARNILIVGSDTRGDLAAGEGTQGRGDGVRHRPAVRHHDPGAPVRRQRQGAARQLPARLVGDHPRLHRPGHRRAVEEHDGKLNSAFEDGGPALLIRTIETLSSLRVDNYLQIDFEGFQKMVNTLGGVEVCLSQPAKEKDSGIDLQAGRQTIEGAQALAFVRQRKGLPRRRPRPHRPPAAVHRRHRPQDPVGGHAAQPVQAQRRAQRRDRGACRSTTAPPSTTCATSPPASAPSAPAASSSAPCRSRTPAAFRDRQSVVLLDEPKMAELFAALRNDVPPGHARGQGRRRPRPAPLDRARRRRSG